MTAFVLSTNLYTFAQARKGFFAWPEGTGEAEVIQALNPGDVIVPKFAQSSSYGDDVSRQRSYCESIGLIYERVAAEYDSTIAGGESAVPFLMKVISHESPDDRQSGVDWARVTIELEDLGHPLSTQEFLRLRALPPEIAAQFKATVAQGRHLQEVPDALVEQVREAASSTEREHLLRRYSIVEAPTSEEASEILVAGNRSPEPGDQAFVVSSGGLLGLHEVSSEGELRQVRTTIEKTPHELLDLIEEAKSKSTTSDYFTPQNSVLALQELLALLESPEPLKPIDDFGRFYDRYVLLDKKITQAFELAARTRIPPRETEPQEADESRTEADEAAALHGLTVDAVRSQLPEGIVLPDSVLAEAVTALRSGKHLLIGGPPGTGKSTLAEALCRAVMGNQYHVATGTADWTTFDTIGGYVPTDDGLDFEAGIILRALLRGAWVVIDELNRADIDKAFGPLFTLLAATEIRPGERRRVVLPYRKAGRNVEIRWAETRTESTSHYVVTPTWRLIGTLNLADKASLFQLSFAFLRRFAILNVPLPEESIYRGLLTHLFSESLPAGTDPGPFVDCSLELALGDRELGPAITQDIATFVSQALVETAGGTSAYDDPVMAYLTALRLYTVPQYEGASADEISRALGIVHNTWQDRPGSDFSELEKAFELVSL